MRFSRLGTSIAASALFALAGSAEASLFSPGPDPFPNGSSLLLTPASGSLCPLPNVCLKVARIENLQLVSANSIAGGFDEKLTATLFTELINTANGKTRSSTFDLVPGTFLDASITGGYNPFTNPVGTFPETINTLDFAGVNFIGDVITASLAGAPTVGSVTIRPADDGFLIDNVLTIHAEATVNGVPRPLPPFTATGASVPEASAWTLMLVGLGGLGVVMRSRRRPPAPPTISAATGRGSCPRDRPWPATARSGR